MGKPQLSRSLKKQRAKAQGSPRDDVALVGLDVAQQLPELLRISDRGEVTCARRRQTTGTLVHEIPGRLQRANIDRVLEHVLHRLAYPLCCL